MSETRAGTARLSLRIPATLTIGDRTWQGIYETAGEEVILERDPETADQDQFRGVDHDYQS